MTTPVAFRDPRPRALKIDVGMTFMDAFKSNMQSSNLQFPIMQGIMSLDLCIFEASAG